uniref:Uncharacterized protein n=1 Tax=Percolomonas cosmopolitus TaxID=63605 RepID=A0A7S1KRD4_9EUKA|mmetsp:Transcript_5435/g.20303  ORF Transcript_5435/g.20303 Transcript_5435/m.20303 type:complete len:160 (+) Transcript_5435:510-989(+)
MHVFASVPRVVLPFSYSLPFASISILFSANTLCAGASSPLLDVKSQSRSQMALPSSSSSSFHSNFRVSPHEQVWRCREEQMPGKGLQKQNLCFSCWIVFWGWKEGVDTLVVVSFHQILFLPIPTGLFACAQYQRVKELNRMKSSRERKYDMSHEQLWGE